MFERKEPFPLEPWGELLITVLLLLMGRVGLTLAGWWLGALSTPVRISLPTFQEPDMEKGGEEKRKRN